MTTTTPECVNHLPGWLSPAEADALFETLIRDIPWEQKAIRMYGRETAVPRLTSWFGDVGYTYSGTTNAAHAWLPELEDLRARLETTTTARFNSCLANLYRDGHDSVSWHADDEPELGPEPIIGSVSLGSTRDFKIRNEATSEIATIPLGHGDLVVMRGESQADYRHSVPKRAHADARINLTFRHYTERKRP